MDKSRLPRILTLSPKGEMINEAGQEFGRQDFTGIAGYQQVSRRHAKVSINQEGRGIQVEDLGSMNGTFIYYRQKGRVASNPTEELKPKSPITLPFAVLDGTVICMAACGLQCHRIASVISSVGPKTWEETPLPDEYYWFLLYPNPPDSTVFVSAVIGREDAGSLDAEGETIASDINKRLMRISVHLSWQGQGLFFRRMEIR